MWTINTRSAPCFGLTHTPENIEMRNMRDLSPSFFINSSKKWSKSCFQRVEMNKAGTVQCFRGHNMFCYITLCFLSASRRRASEKGRFCHLITDV